MNYMQLLVSNTDSLYIIFWDLGGLMFVVVDI